MSRWVRSPPPDTCNPRKLHRQRDTFSADKSPAVLEVLEEDGAGVVVHIDERNGDDSAVKRETNVPRKHNHGCYQYLNVIKLMSIYPQSLPSAAQINT
jgi:hypothetical protein